MATCHLSEWCFTIRELDAHALRLSPKLGADSSAAFDAIGVPHQARSNNALKKLVRKILLQFPINGPLIPFDLTCAMIQARPSIAPRVIGRVASTAKADVAKLITSGTKPRGMHMVEELCAYGMQVCLKENCLKRTV